MLWALTAGILNAIGAVFLKKSNQNIYLVFLALSLFGLNFLFFRVSLKVMAPSMAYGIVIMTTLAILKSVELVAGDAANLPLNAFGLLLMGLGIYIMN